MIPDTFCIPRSVFLLAAALKSKLLCSKVNIGNLLSDDKLGFIPIQIKQAVDLTYQDKYLSDEQLQGQYTEPPEWHKLYRKTLHL